MGCSISFCHPSGARGFAVLPPELFLEIAGNLVNTGDLNSLLRTCRGSARILSLELMKRGVAAVDRDTRRSLLYWASA